MDVGHDVADIVKSTAQLTDDAASSPHSLRKKIKPALRKAVNALAKTTVEPCVIVYMVSISISALAVQAMNLDKACRMNLDLGDELCDRIAAGNSTDAEEEFTNMQTLVARVTSWKMPLQTILPGLLMLFLGEWSDRTRRRKVCILVPMIGEMVTCIGLLLSTYFMRSWSLEVTALIEALPPALTGGWITLFMGVFSYVTDMTDIQERTFRVGVVSVCGTLGSPTGTALSGVLLKYLGYYGVFSLLLSLHAMSFLYGIVFLKDVEIRPNNGADAGEKESTWNIFINSIQNTVMVLFKRRSGTTRFQIGAVLVLYFLMVGPLYGDGQASYLYTTYKFHFTALEFSLYSTISTLAGLIGMVFCMTVLVRLLGVADSAIGLLSCTSRIAACFVACFSPTKAWFYSVPAFNIFSQAGLVAVRAMSSKLVAKDEVGKISSLLGVFEGIAPSVYVPVSSSIYIATLKTLPGAFYLFDVALTLVAVVLFGTCYYLWRRERRPSTAKTSTEHTRRNPEDSPAEQHATDNLHI